VLPEQPCHALLHLEGEDALLRTLSAEEAHALERVWQGEATDTQARATAKLLESLMGHA
jgi:hypothetical protein